MVTDAPFSDKQIEAMARWHTLGSTSLTNPVLAFVMNTFLEPLGITADWVEYDVTSAHLLNARPRLVRPQFKPMNIRGSLSGDHAAAFFPLKEHVQYYRAKIGPFGEMAVEIDAPDGNTELLANDIVERLMYAAEHAPRLAADAFNHLSHFAARIAPILISQSEFAAARQADIAAGDYRAFCVTILDNWGKAR